VRSPQRCSAAVTIALIAAMWTRGDVRLRSQSASMTSLAPTFDGTCADLGRQLDVAERAIRAGDRTRARTLLDGLPREARCRGDAADEAQTLLRLGGVTNRVDALQRARTLFEQLGDARQLLTTYSVLVYVLPKGEEKVRYREAALALAPSVRPRDAECNVRHQWGDEEFNAGRLAVAFDTLTQALECYRTTVDRGREGRVLVSLGRVQRAHGRLARALELYKQALALQEQVHDEPAAIQSVNAIAATLAYMGRYTESLARYEEALTRARAISLPAIGVILGNVGGAYLAQGRDRDAIARLNEALTVSPTSFPHLRLAQLARAYRHLGELDKALEYGDQAVTRGVDQGPGAQIETRSARAGVYIALGRFDAASADLDEAIRLVEQLRANTVASDYMKRGFSDEHQRTFATMIDLQHARGDHRRALETAERARNRALLDLLASRAASRPTNAAGSTRRTSEPASLDEIVAAARRLGSTFLCYWVGASTTTIWVVSADGLRTSVRVDVPEGRLAELVHKATGAGDGPVDTGVAMLAAGSARRPWRELHRLLIEPVRHRLPTRAGARLTIVPHGPLSGLSFAGLRDEQGRYLLETHDLHYVPAVAVLAFTSQRQAAHGGALLVGDPGPFAAAAGEPPLPALPWARREVETVRGSLHGAATVLIGERATEAAVRSSAPGRAIVHLATHGIIRNDESLTSYLALGGVGASDESDGRLTADEVYSLPLDAELVVLSACRTALGPSNGDGVFGFTRAFLYAGASTVAATMWDVPDQTTWRVMRDFYARRASGLTTSRALRAAQLALLRALRAGTVRLQGQVMPESPRLWAGFVLVGEP
jgi:CHAT domain-containing protein/tetratricopeptide (TPR) repeat protein